MNDEGPNDRVRIQDDNETDEEDQATDYYPPIMTSMLQVMPQPPYGYHMDPHWVAPNHIYGQQFFHHHQQPYGYHFPLQHMDGIPLPPGIPGLGGSTDPLEAVLGPFPCTRLRNLPYDVTLEDILVLFQGLIVIDVILAGGGEAFVIFANPMDFQMALQRNRQTLNRRFIEISVSSRAEYYEAVATIHEQERGPKLTTGLGFRSDEAFRRNDVREEKRSTGEHSALAALWGQPTTSPPSMQSLSPQPGFSDSLLLHATSGMSLGGRSLGSATASGQSRVLHASVQKRAGGGLQIGDHTGFLRMRGLPFSATKDDIYKFFNGYNPVQESIVLTYRNDGRATGEAYIGFGSPEDSKRAMELHRRTLGSRYIELFISNKDEQGRALARFGNR